MRAQHDGAEDESDRQEPQEVIVEELEVRRVCGEHATDETRRLKAFSDNSKAARDRATLTDVPGPRELLRRLRDELVDEGLALLPERHGHVADGADETHAHQRTVKEQRKQVAPVVLV